MKIYLDTQKEFTWIDDFTKTAHALKLSRNLLVLDYATSESLYGSFPIRGGVPLDQYFEITRSLLKDIL